MDRKELSKIRQRLGKSQKEMAQLLAISLKAVQSFEQGWVYQRNGLLWRGSW
jgi:DNA-binding XRE family transcriptional regulator